MFTPRADMEGAGQCLEPCVRGLENLGHTWQGLDGYGYRPCLETIEKAVLFPWGNGLFLGNCIGGLLGPIQMTHGRCFVGLTRSFNPRKADFFTHTLYPFRQVNVFKLACKICTDSEPHSPVGIFWTSQTLAIV